MAINFFKKFSWKKDEAPKAAKTSLTPIEEGKSPSNNLDSGSKTSHFGQYLSKMIQNILDILHHFLPRPVTKSEIFAQEADYLTGSKASAVQPRASDTPSSVKTAFAVRPHAIFHRLVMTAKAGRVGNRERYVFEVDNHANKIEIKKAFYSLYGVMPFAVATSIHKPKKVRSGRNFGSRKKWKKATITIDANKSVTIV